MGVAGDVTFKSANNVNSQNSSFHLGTIIIFIKVVRWVFFCIIDYNSFLLQLF